MRISDWSSDVCSSDLPLVAQRRGHHHIRGRDLRVEDGLQHPAPPGEHRAALFGDQRRRLGAPGDLRVAQAELLAGQPFGAARLDRGVGRGERGYRLTGREDRQAGAVRQPLPRSEEHTSELQSLMRISYAVFCLKKKKKRTQQQYKKTL